MAGCSSRTRWISVAASLGDQIRYLRNHPSIFIWVLASDLLPRPGFERRY